MNDYCVAVTGLPASGKTTIGNLLAAELDVPCLNKDTSLERLFDERCGGNEGYRQRRSRESDDAFRAAETALNRVVLISHWRPLGSHATSGTPYIKTGTEAASTRTLGSWRLNTPFPCGWGRC